MISHIHPIPAFTDNYIWAIHKADSENLAVVDPGDPCPVIDYIQKQGLTLSHILITHHHPDHVGGLPKLIEAYSPIVYGPQPSNIAGITQYLHKGDCIDLFGTQFEIIEVPGHTLDHIAYYRASRQEKEAEVQGRHIAQMACENTSDKIENKSGGISTPLLFCGDTLFAAGCGRLFEGTPQMMLSSLDKLGKLDPNTAVYCTHEYTLANLKFALEADGDNPQLQRRVSNEQAKRETGKPTLPSSLALELATNPFLRYQQPEIIRRVSAVTGLKSTDPVDVFAALRSWKDNF
ncbi:MAG: hydroxyacylglutathione hydrolase [Gammaproteobacteria bacterium]|nr:hydroxyacylglutathione hydrolase [Gammaproteobacteria bacterium]